ncbi:ATP-dependent DNA helicase RecG [Calidifontibacter terrae]
MKPITRTTPLKGIVSDHFTGRIGESRQIETVGQLLDFLPRRYLDVNAAGRLSEFSFGDMAVLIATVVKAQGRRMQNGKRMLTATIEDADGQTASLVFFRAAGHEQNLVPGTRALFRGKLQSYNQMRQLAHPEYTAITGDSEEARLFASGMIPTYLPIPKVNDLAVSIAMRQVLAAWDGADPVPEELRKAHDLVGIVDAYRMIHLPTSQGEAGLGRRRLRYDEALVVQTALAARRAEHDAQPATARVAREGGLLAAFDERLPFELTRGQQAVGAEIAADLARERPMNRLLQGEVGSGKTIVALRAMLATVDAGAQAALLAPTEVLAHQHDRSIRRMLGDLAEGGMLGGADNGTQVGLLTGSMTRSQKEQVLLGVITGDTGILIGTHAIIQDTVKFMDLGLVVVDEQHRFGVEQRDALRGKAARPPHVLVMTATPIPRTVAMTVFGDMETSELAELPAGRAPIVSHVVPVAKPGWVQRVWDRLAEEVAAGHQAYVVCPRIGDDEPEDLLELESYDDVEDESGESAEARPAKRPLTSVVTLLEQLRSEPALSGLRIDMLHGRMTPDDKDAVMGEFSAGRIDILVSTTVIEVGVDVPNSTAMVIMDADRFGISQLHQLRGRVGRGSAGGLCLLVTATENADTMDRLAAVAATTNGFELADLDLSLRKEGDVLGKSQSGRQSGLQLLRLTHPADVELINLARQDAAEIIARDPHLHDHPALADLLTQRLDEDQIAFLERG